MAKGQNLSRYQQGVVRRYYEHGDSRTLAQLQELVSDLALATEDKSRAKLWAKVEPLLERAGAGEARRRQVLAMRDVRLLAALVGELLGQPPKK